MSLSHVHCPTAMASETARNPLTRKEGRSEKAGTGLLVCVSEVRLGRCSCALSPPRKVSLQETVCVVRLRQTACHAPPALHVTCDSRKLARAALISGCAFRTETALPPQGGGSCIRHLWRGGRERWQAGSPRPWHGMRNSQIRRVIARCVPHCLSGLPAPTLKPALPPPTIDNPWMQFQLP